MGYYDDDGNYHSFSRSSDKRYPIVEPLHSPEQRDHWSSYESQQVVPVPCRFVRIGDILILSNRPCQVIRISVNPQTGQHRYLGVDLFTRQLQEEDSFISNPSPGVVVQTMLGPSYSTYRVLDVDLSDCTVLAMTETGDIKPRLPVIKQGRVITNIEKALEGEGSTHALAISELGTGRELVVDYKVVHRGQGKRLESFNTGEPSRNEDSSDDDIDVEIYRFSMVGGQSGVLRTEDQIMPLPQVRGTLPSNSTTHEVYNSIVEDDNRVNFYVQKLTTDGSQSLFRWIHLKRSDMQFRELKETALSIPGMVYSEQIALKRLFQKVGEEYDHEPSPGTTGRYMKPGYLAETFQEETGPGHGVVSWLCFPYFRFHQLCTTDNISRDSYPMQRLLQELLLSPEREMNQVMSRTRPQPTNECLHIAQMWAVEVNNSLLLTYGDMELSNFSHMKFQHLPPSQSTQVPKSWPRKIFVSFHTRVMWSLPLDSCLTWPSFLSHFVELDTSHMVFTQKGKVVEPDDFTALLKTEHSIRLALDIREGSDSLPPEAHGGFTVFEWLAEMDQASQHDDDLNNQKKKRLMRRLELMDKFLHEQEADSSSYRRVASLDCYEVRGLLKEDEPATSLAMRTTKAAETLYSFFAPLNIMGLVLGKYWGAVYLLIQELSSDPQEDFCNQLMDLALRTVPIKLLFSRSHLPKFPNDNPFHLLEIAWMHLLMSLIYIKRKPRRSRQHMDICSKLFELGVIQAKKDFPIQDRKGKVVLPLDIATTMAAQLLDKASPDTSLGRISISYSKHLRDLTPNVQLDQLDKSHKDDIDLLQNEIRLIQEVLSDQRALMHALHGPNPSLKSEIQLGSRERMSLRDNTGGTNPKSMETMAVSDMNVTGKSYTTGPRYHRSSRTSRGSHTSLSSSFSKDCGELIDKTAAEFNHLMAQTGTLKQMNDKKIQNDKSRQEFAIYAFTVVTIIFLPLNTVSSIFGMNTSDIRDIESGQWIYWAVAIPLTVIVVALTLLWAGEFQTVWKSVKDFLQFRGNGVQPPQTDKQKLQP